jgi:hypothetical protein
MQPTDGALSAIQSAGHDRITIDIGIEYILGAHLYAYSAGLAPSPVD